MKKLTSYLLSDTKRAHFGQIQYLDIAKYSILQGIFHGFPLQ